MIEIIRRPIAGARLPTRSALPVVVAGVTEGLPDIVRLLLGTIGSGL